MAGGQAEIDLAVAHLSALLERHMPDLIRSFTLIGSAADGDFRVGKSDLDFVAVLARPLSEADIEGLVILHRLYAADMTLATLDGLWLTQSELAAGPDAVPAGPSTRDGEFLATATGNRNPVTWVMLREQSRTVIGELDRTALWRDDARLMSWTRENVESYWAPWLKDASRPMGKLGLWLLGGAGVMWAVLGISRLHYTLATAHVTSKSGAGEHALEVFEPRWHGIVAEALRLRRGEGGGRYANPLARRREVLDYVAMVIAAMRAGG